MRKPEAATRRPLRDQLRSDLVVLIRHAADTSKNGTTNCADPACGENIALSREVNPRVEMTDRRTVEQERDHHCRAWQQEVAFYDDHDDTAEFSGVIAS